MRLVYAVTEGTSTLLWASSVQTQNFVITRLSNAEPYVTLLWHVTKTVSNTLRPNIESICLFFVCLTKSKPAHKVRRYAWRYICHSVCPCMNKLCATRWRHVSVRLLPYNALLSSSSKLFLCTRITFERCSRVSRAISTDLSMATLKPADF